MTLDVFTDCPFGGNPLAVFPDGRGLPDATLQAIAAEFNLSETVFVVPPQRPEHDARLRIFTPRSEIAFAGHPIIGAAHALAAQRFLPTTAPVTSWTFEVPAGPVRVSVRLDGDEPIEATLEAPHPPRLLGRDMTPAAAAAALSLDPADVLGQPALYSGGLPFWCVRVASRAALNAVRFSARLWLEHVAGPDSVSLYVFWYDSLTHIAARMFAPALGIAEDPATGSAAVALAGLLSETLTSDGRSEMVIVQGEDMGRPSRLKLELVRRDRRLDGVFLSGCAVPIAEGTMRLPSPPNF